MNNQILNHIAIIMDGNGRWANALHKKRSYGHFVGAQTADRLIRKAASVGLKFLTLYAFSTENWKRPKPEINFLMLLLNRQLLKKEKLFFDERIRFNVIGDITVLSAKTQNIINDITTKTKSNERMVLTFALNYGSKDEILRCIKLIAKDVKENQLSIESINKELISHYLYTNGLPDVDLVIRTGGEYRLSNFLMWQASYAELIFFDKYWPDFTEDDFDAAIDEFKKRKRKFGAV